MPSLPLRELSSQQREKAFSRGRGHTGVDLTSYLDTVREMEGGAAYAIPTGGLTARAMHVRLNRAAKQLGLRLRWANVSKDAKEVIVELREPTFHGDND